MPIGSINVEATLSNDCFDKVECCIDNVERCFDIVAVLATMSKGISSFWQSRNKLNMFSLFRLCRKDEISITTRSTLLPKRQQSRTLLRHYCWCGPGLSFNADGVRKFSNRRLGQSQCRWTNGRICVYCLNMTFKYEFISFSVRKFMKGRGC